MPQASDEDPTGLNRIHPSEHGIGPDKDNPYNGFDEKWWSDRRQRVRAMARCGYWTFVPHTQNHPTRKVVTSTLMVTWATITVGQAYGIAETGTYYPWITAIALSIVCTIWGFELGMLGNIANNDTNDD